eukprot:11539600-Karenia_brevis.AAC.1
MDAAGSAGDDVALPFNLDVCDVFSPPEDVAGLSLTEDSDDDADVTEHVDVPDDEPEPQEEPRTSEQVMQANRRIADESDALFQLYQRESPSWHNDITTIDKDPSLWLIAWRAQSRRAVSLW